MQVLPKDLLKLYLFVKFLMNRFDVSKNFENNKDTLTGPENCNKTNRHHAHLLLCAKSRKTNDAKSRNWPSTSIRAIFF